MPDFTTVTGQPNGTPRNFQDLNNGSFTEVMGWPKANRGGRVGLHRVRQRISGSSAGCCFKLPIGAVMQGGRSPTGVTAPIGGRGHAAIASGRLSKYAWSGVLAAKLECGLLAL